MSEQTASKQLVTTPAPLTKKLGAWLYDALICVAIWFLWGLFTFPLIRWLLGVDDIYTGQDTLLYKIYSVLPALLILFYFVGSHVRFGQTVGMSSWKLMLVQKDGKPVTFGQALLRDITAVLGIGMLFSLFNSKKLGWHDIISGTRVVALPDKQKD
ncbi:RDD family protein [Kangiella sp.]|uniref:RDD family protein n=1 Tax=Kangiella sp. TaxID=1920245 RepID=UPI0019A8BF95|nr:RDD family protein [Kangiella sp.]MBD3654366.1 RDD family protein [Kangiella sp.]